LPPPPPPAAKTAPAERRALSDEMQRVFSRELVPAYDQRQWKKGVKAADRILAEFPEHGETVAMKGLIVHSMGPARRAEAHELGKLALRYDIRSHVCWHVYGLIHRAEANYAEAVKCYKNALRIDPDKCVGDHPAILRPRRMAVPPWEAPAEAPPPRRRRYSGGAAAAAAVAATAAACRSMPQHAAVCRSCCSRRSRPAAVAAAVATALAVAFRRCCSLPTCWQ